MIELKNENITLRENEANKILQSRNYYIFNPKNTIIILKSTQY